MVATTPSPLRILLENVDFRLPTQVTDDNSVIALKSLCFEPLLRWQPGGLVKPGLFSSWTLTPPSTSSQIWTYTFHIRPSAIFHDSLPCTAPLIVEYIKGFLKSRDYFDMPWSYARYFKLAEARFEAKDEATVTITSPGPFADLLDILCEFWPCRMDADGKPVLGTGPYRVVEFKRIDGVGRAVLQRVDDDSNSKYPQTIIASQERDGNKRLDALRSGSVDVALNLERADDLDAVDFGGSLQWGRVHSTLSAMYYLNSTSGVFTSQNARLAANMAVDSFALVKEVFHGLAVPSATIVSPHHLGFKQAGLKPIPYDPEAAKKLLENTDFSAPITLRTPQYMPEHAEKISAFVAKSLEAVGFNVNVSVETNRPEYARSIGLRKDIGDLALFDSTPNSTFRVLDDKVSSSSKNTWWLGYHDKEIQRLIGEAKREIGDDERGEAYAKCLKRLQENPPWLYIAHPDVVWASRPGIKLEIGPSGVLTLG